MTRGSRQAFTIGSVARQAGVCVETVRYYHRIGLLPLPSSPPGRAVRHYGNETLQQLQFIKRAQRLGFSLEEIGTLIALSEGSHCADVQAIAREKLLMLEEKMAALAAMRQTILDLLMECASSDDEMHCPFIDALAQQGEARDWPLDRTKSAH
jgi:MerR family mercuric resistance operon transcriptional regulator